MPINLETTMESMDSARGRETRRKRHAVRLSQRAIRNAGTPTHVGAAIGKRQSTVSHYATDKVHPRFRESFEVLLNLTQHPGVSGRAYVAAVNEAVELGELVHEDAGKLIARGFVLLGREDQLEANENGAAKSGVGFSDALRAEADLQTELAAIIDELEFRGVDLLGLYRERAA